MPFVSGFKNDVFISYAHADNASAGTGNGWVSDLVAHLDCALRQRLGGVADLKVFFDSRHLASNNQLDELLQNARESAVFLAVTSRSYVSRDWTVRELTAFSEAAKDPRRLFVAECLPLDDTETFPEAIRDHKRLGFWRIDAPHSTVPISLSPANDANRFYALVCDLAEQIRQQLMTLRQSSLAGETGTGLSPASKPPAAGRTVLLAQSTDDLEDEVDQIRRYLEQYDVTVLPEQPYPQGGEAFRAALVRDLARADIFIQLLGRRPGRMPPDLPEGYTRYQFSQAVAAGLDVMQWRRSDIDVAEVADEDYRTLLNGASVVVSTLEDFKSKVRDAAQAPEPQQTDRGQRPSLVFINASDGDLDIAKTIQAEFSRQSVPTALPLLEGGAEEIRADLEENLIDCDALVLVYGNATPVWMRGQLRLFNKLTQKREGPPKVLAIYSGPPNDKPDVGMSFPDARIIDCRQEWSVEPIRSLISELNS